MSADVRKAFLDGIAWMSERTYLSADGGYHVAEPSEADIRRAADEYVRPRCLPGECHCEMKGLGCPHRQL